LPGQFLAARINHPALPRRGIGETCLGLARHSFSLDFEHIFEAGQIQAETV